MLAALFLLVTSAAGFAVATRAVPSAPAIVRLPAGFLLSVVVTSWTTYLVADGLSGQTTDSLKIGLIASTLLGVAVLALVGRSLRWRDLRIPWLDLAVTVVTVLLAYWIINAHLHNENGELMVSYNTWADMGLHIGLSRSFAVGANYPTEYPFFAGPPIHYHFGFDFFAGALQAGGMSVLWSFNLPGVIGLSSMMLTTFAIARLLFSPADAPRWRRDKGVWIGITAAAFVVTNQSLAWLRYVQKDGHGSVLEALKPSVFWNHKDYLAIGPYSDDRISIFNTLNPYLTQMHLIVAMALVLVLVYALLWMLRDGGGALDKRLLAGLGAIFGLSFWLNGVLWIGTAVFVAALLGIWALMACRRARREAEPGQRGAALRAEAISWVKVGAAFAVPALLLGIPQAAWLSHGTTGGGLSVEHVGYLVCGSTKSSCHGGHMNLLSLADWWSFAQYWWLNEGVFIPLLVVAFILGNARDRKIIAAVTCVFVWGSIFSVGMDLGGQNHKTFNLWEILSGPFAAFALIELWIVGGRQWRRGTRGRRAIGAITRIGVVWLGFFLIVSGLIDFMTVKNDPTVSVFGDPAQRQTTDWIIKETKPHDAFLTDYDQLYTAATMAGRGVALGFTAWAGAAGYDTAPRVAAINEIYATPDRGVACGALKRLGMQYMIVGPQEKGTQHFQVNEELLGQFTAAATFGDGDGAYRIYRVADNC